MSSGVTFKNYFLTEMQFIKMLSSFCGTKIGLLNTHAAITAITAGILNKMFPSHQNNGLLAQLPNSSDKSIIGQMARLPAQSPLIWLIMVPLIHIIGTITPDSPASSSEKLP